MAQPPKKDNFTRNIVIAVVIGVLLIMVVPTVLSKRTDSTAKTPASVSADRNYGITFNGDLTGVPVIDVYEDFQCPVCADFEKLNGDYLESLITDKKATVVYHTLSFLGLSQSMQLMQLPALLMKENSLSTIGLCTQIKKVKILARGQMMF